MQQWSDYLAADDLPDPLAPSYLTGLRDLGDALLLLCFVAALAACLVGLVVSAPH